MLLRATLPRGRKGRILTKRARSPVHGERGEKSDLTKKREEKKEGEMGLLSKLKCGASAQGKRGKGTRPTGSGQAAVRSSLNEGGTEGTATAKKQNPAVRATRWWPTQNGIELSF